MSYRLDVDWTQEKYVQLRGTILLGSSQCSGLELADQLRTDGYEVIETFNTSEFINRFTEAWSGQKSIGPLELVILDLTQPDWANLATLEYVRRVDWSIPVIVINSSTNGKSEEEKLEVAELGATLVFKRPFEMDDLRTAVLNAVPQF